MIQDLWEAQRRENFSGITLLNAVQVLRKGNVLPIGGARSQSLLAVLSLSGSGPVPTDTIVERVWDGRPPRRHRGILHSYVSRLRKILRDSSTDVEIVTTNNGYQLNLNRDLIDLHSARDLAARANSAASTTQEADLLDRSLDWWGTIPLNGLEGLWVDGMRAGLIREYIEVAARRNSAYLRLGRHHETTDALSRLVVDHPLDSRLTALLMLALYRCGRQADALDTYRRLLDHYMSEQGLSPDPPVRALRRMILSQDPDLNSREFLPYT